MPAAAPVLRPPLPLEDALDEAAAAEVVVVAAEGLCAEAELETGVAVDAAPGLMVAELNTPLPTFTVCPLLACGVLLQAFSIVLM